ncbi:sulfurtransferase [Rhizobacter sp. OV335]|uniref:sulfurtransferase n=1 Tax=Rhizobacter sp. OV335 TaxID=1500264 RepID=UPI0009163284|nr:sulfurtransferase [Rhizobacter sp. OV335]SHN36338.1 thiosulfate/3-mercaptopyruvate sulfurtransferase [Rhizobacter sp. OV335]
MIRPPLISAAELQQALRQTQPPLVLDCSFDLADATAGERSFREGHLPGALYVNLNEDLSGPKTGRNGRHPLADRADYARWMGDIGIVPGREVVVYDRQAAMYAVRAWWVLLWMGHPAVRVLDGGLAAWQAAGGALSQETAQPVPAAPYPDAAPQRPTIDAGRLQQRLGEVLVLDARAPERYRGEVEPIDAVAGHIPGAKNRFFKDNLQPDGRFKPADQLRAEFLAALEGRAPESVVNQCGSGVTACHNLLAMEIAGLGGAALYPGSWSEWSSDSARPTEKSPRL